MYLRSVFIHSSSTKKKLNTKIFNEIDLVAANDIILQVLWTNYFLSAQVNDIKKSKIHQDKKYNTYVRKK